MLDWVASMSFRCVFPVVLLALLGAGSGSARAAADEGALLLDAVNALRASRGLSALLPDPRLACAARVHAQAMAREGFFDHDGGSDGGLMERLARAGYGYALAAENLAAGLPAPDEVVAEWLASPGHRDNLLEPAARQAGVGHATASGATFTDYWTLILAQPLAGAEAPVPAEGFCTRD